MSVLAPGELVSVDPATLAEVGRAPSTPLEAVPEIVVEARLAQERRVRNSWDELRRPGPGRVPVPWWYPYGAHTADGFPTLLETTYGRGLVPRAVAAGRGWRGLAGLARRYAHRP